MALSTFLRVTWFLFKSLVLRVIGRAPRGLAAFTEGYGDEDRLISLTASERTRLAAFSRCIGCGLCDAHFDAYDEVARSELIGPSDLPLSYSRNLADFGAVLPYLKNLEKGDLERLERLCPTGVPLRELAELVGRVGRATRAPEPERAERRPPHDPG